MARTLAGSRRDGIMRVRGRFLESPVVEYHHGVTGAELLLILNCHMGTPEYWAQIRKLIAGREQRGWSVQAEGLRVPSAADLAAASADELAARAVMTALVTDQPAAVAARLGWVYQREGLPVPGGWVSADMTDLDVIRAATPADILARGQASARDLARAGARAAEWQAAVFPLAWYRQARPYAWLDRIIARLVAAGSLPGVLVDQRSDLAAAPDTDRNWVLVWGAGHDATISAALAAAGWVPVGARGWLTVGKLPSRACLCAVIVKVAAGAARDTWRAQWQAEQARRD